MKQYIFFWLCIFVNGAVAQLACQDTVYSGVNFAYSPTTNLCAGDVISFNGTTNGAAYSWFFDHNNATSSQQNPTHTFPLSASTQSYQVSYVVLDTTGVDTCRVKVKTITFNSQTANLSVTNPGFFFTYCASSVFDTTFTSNFVINNPVAGATYSWSFGDNPATNVSSTATTQSHTYNGFGTYTLKVYINGDVCPSFVQQVKVYSEPVASMGLPSTGTPPVPIASYCEGTAVNIANLSTMGNAITYTWNWGDGTIYTVANENTQSHSFTYDNVNLCNPNVASFSYNVGLTASNSCPPYNHLATVQVNIIPRPRANFTIPDTVCVNNIVPFTDNTCPACGPGLTNTYSWYFGDATAPSYNNCANPNTTHIYTSTGIFTVMLVVKRNNSACGILADTMTKTIVVTAPPVVNVTVNPTGTVFCAPKTFVFTNNTTPNVGVYYKWSVSPASGYQFVPPSGTVAYTKNATINFTQAGVYTITMKAWNDCDTSYYTRTITIKNKPTINYAQINDVCLLVGATTTSICPMATFNNNLGATPISYSWFVNGVGATTATIPCYNAGVGIDTLYIGATNECGTTIRRDTFEVISQPTAAFTINPNTANICLTTPPYQVTFTNTSANAITQGGFWAFTPAISVSQIVSGALNNISIPLVVNFSSIGDYTVTLSVNGKANCGTDTVQKILHFRKKPTVVLNVPNFTGCGPITLCPTAIYNANNGTISNYSWSFGGGLPNSNNLPTPPCINFPYGSGQHLIKIEVTNQCGKGKDSTFINIPVPSPIVLPADTLQVCKGKNLVLNATSPLSGSWFDINTNTNISTTSIGNATFLSNTVGNYWVYYQNGSGTCLTKDSILLIVNPLPSPPSNANISLCQGSPNYFLPTTSVCASCNCVWKNNLGNVVTTASTATFGTFTYWRVCTNTITGCKDSLSQIVTINPNPSIVGIPNNATYCVNPLAITLPTPTSPLGANVVGVWTCPNPNITIINGAFVANTTGNFVFTYTAINNITQCSSFVTMNVAINNATAVNAGNDTSLCVNSPCFTLSLQPSTAIWSGNITSPNQFCPNTVGSFTLTLSNNVGDQSCWRSDTKIITVHALPNITVLPSVDNICAGTLMYNLATASPSGGTWSGLGIVGGTNITGLFNPALISLTPPTIATTILNYTYTDSNTGCTNSKPKTVNIQPLPVAPIAPASVTYCVNTIPVALPSLVCPVGSTCAWLGNVAINGNTFNTSFSGQGSFTIYYVVTTNAPFFCKDSSAMVVNVIGTVPPIITINDTTLCKNEGCITLTANVSGGTWGGSVSNGNQFCPATSAAGANTVTYTVGSGSCITSSSQILWVDNPPVLSIINDNICPYTLPYLLSGGSPTGGTYSGGNVSGSIYNTSALTVGNTDNVIYTYTDNNTNCTSTITKVVTKYPAPIAIFTVGTPYCKNGAISFNNGVTTSASYLWNFGDVGSPTNTSTIATPSHIYNNIGNYTITMVVTANNAGQCKDTAIQTINVIEVPTASFALSDTVACSSNLSTGQQGLTITATNTSTGLGNLSYQWLVAGANQVYTNASIQTNPTFLLLQGQEDTTYFIKLIVSNECGNDVFIKTVKIHPIPNVNFGPNYTGCSPVQIQFPNATMLSTGSPTSFFWNFGNGNMWNDSIPPLQIFTTGNQDTIYPITLKDSSVCGLDIDTVYVTVHPNTVNAYFGVNTQSGCAPLTINVTNYSNGSTIIYDLGISGGGGYSPNFSFTFNNPGVYHIKQYANNGCSYDTFDVPITVYTTPTPNFTFTTAPPCKDSVVQFSSTSVGNIWGYSWNFGVNTTSSDTAIIANPTYTFISAGTYQVTLTVSADSNGCMASITKPIVIQPSPLLNFTLNDSLGCAPFVLDLTNQTSAAAHFWLFDNINSSVQPQPNYVFNMAGIHTVYYKATNNLGCENDTSFTVIAKEKPTAAFIPSELVHCGDSVQIFFTNASLGTTLSYNWNFGNGNISTNPSDSVIYLNTGTYTPSLVIENMFGCKDTSAQTIQILPQPIAHFLANDTSGCVSLTISCNNQSSNANGYNWSINNATTLNPPLITYSLAGDYTIQLIANYNNQCFDTTNQIIHVGNVPNAIFTANLTGDICGGPATLLIQNNSTYTDSVYWTLDNNIYSTNFTPTYVYQLPGTYPIHLVVFNDFGCKDSMSQTLVVNPQPAAQFSLNDTMNCAPMLVNFTNNSINYTSTTVIFGDGTPNENLTTNLIHTYYGNNVVYHAILIANYQNVCFDSVKQDIYVGHSPQSDFTIKLLGDTCGGPALLTLDNQSLYADNYIWSLGNGEFSQLFEPTAIYDNAGVYYVQLVAMNNYGCTDSLTDSTRVYPQVVSNFSATPLIACNPSLHTFNVLSQNSNSYVWEFGDGNTASTTNNSITHIYSNAGTYTVSLHSFVDGVCEDTKMLTNYIKVVQSPIDSFDYSIVPISPYGGQVQFINYSQFANSYSWDFGDSNFDTTLNPIHRYYEAGSFIVFLYAENAAGCKDTSNKIIIVPNYTGLFVPNALMPGDGVFENSVFLPKGVNLIEYDIAVYSKWGDEIWRSTKLIDGQPAEYWDGTDKNKIPVNSGVYTWIVHKAVFKGNQTWGGMFDKEKNRYESVGKVTLIR